ncbi:TetR/AcrR family transcriptional regulator [Photobacterium kishitanii]|uniref:TetR/AcrR family transcriptional regulator n=1 Tax=Photobacterium kishitanii TaxID=318456 RepID=UPI000D167AF4|nr:TetR/AcrR family transcriptional regulator [Photobacterium kishitanii]PSU86700.1 TetR/AcrR family transcriptional regulator [Photobacterium kishitanii]
MSRYKKLDRNRLLDAAECVILSKGAHTLSIGSVAAEAGVSRGGIQSNFGSREALIKALFDRWDIELADYNVRAKELAPEVTDPFELQIMASRASHNEKPQRAAAMMILMTQSEEQRKYARDWFAEQISGLDLAVASDRKQLLRYVAYEALGMLKSLQITTLSDQDWQDLLEEFDCLFNAK